MNIESFIESVLITEARDFTPVQQRIAEIRNVRLIHAAAGLVSEITELIELTEKPIFDRVNLLEECGDMLWYMGIAADELKAADAIMRTGSHIPEGVITPYAVTVTRETALDLAKLAGDFADKAIKKFIFYGKPFDATPLILNLNKIHGHLVDLLHLNGFTIEEARKKNADKLRARYGEKFTEHAALNRDLETERKILES